MDAYSRSDRRRARLALLLFVIAICEGASEPDGVLDDRVVSDASEMVTGP